MTTTAPRAPHPPVDRRAAGRSPAVLGRGARDHAAAAARRGRPRPGAAPAAAAPTPTLPFYRRHYDAHGFHPDQVRSLEDFTTLVPVVTKKDLVADQAAHPPVRQLPRGRPRPGRPGARLVGHQRRAHDVRRLARRLGPLRPGDGDGPVVRGLPPGRHGAGDVPVHHVLRRLGQRAGPGAAGRRVLPDRLDGAPPTGRSSSCTPWTSTPSSPRRPT